MVKRLDSKAAKKAAEKQVRPEDTKNKSMGKNIVIDGWVRVGKDWLSSAIPEGEVCAARIREVDKTTFYCYREGHYLGSEKTLELAKRRVTRYEMRELNDRVRAWEVEHPGEIPPFLQLTDKEREIYRRHNPARPGAARTTVASSEARPNEDPATRRLRESLALSGGKRAARAEGAGLVGRMVRLQPGNPKKAGSAPHARWALMFEHCDAGSTVAQFLAAKGNPTTLENAVKTGWVKLEEKT